MQARAWPNGLLGPMVMPEDWYGYIGLPKFDRDWQDMMRSWQQWKRPIRAMEQRRREKQQDAWRRWWYSLSKREQSYWLGRRVDGEFPNILRAAMGEFKGPKRQRGSIIMALPASMSAHTLSLDSANNSAINIDVFPPHDLYASFYWESDGTLDRDNSGDTSFGRNPSQINAATDWVRPNRTAVGNMYELKWDVTVGISADVNDETWTEDTWLNISASRRVGMVWGQGDGVPTVTFQADIGLDGTSSSLINQDYVIQSGDLI